jgi:hypothetical protein
MKMIFAAKVQVFVNKKLPSSRYIFLGIHISLKGSRFKYYLIVTIFPKPGQGRYRINNSSLPPCFEAYFQHIKHPGVIGLQQLGVLDEILRDNGKKCCNISGALQSIPYPAVYI